MAIAAPDPTVRPGLRAPGAAVPADVPGVDLLQSFLTPGPVPLGDGPRARDATSTDPVRRPCARRAVVPRRSSRRACWRRRRCRRPSFEATFPIMAGLMWSGPSTRCTRRRSRRATSPSATSPGSPSGCLGRHDLHRRSSSLFGAADSPLIVLAIPAAVLTGLAFAAPIAAFSATQRTPEKFAAMFRFGITPLFLFSGHVLPGLEPAACIRADRLGDAAVARRRADRGAGARARSATTPLAGRSSTSRSSARHRRDRRRPGPSGRSSRRLVRG